MKKTLAGRGLGCLTDIGDIRDLYFGMPSRVAALPHTVDLRSQMTPPGDQGQLGSCTAWAALRAWRFALQHAKLPDMEPSHLAQYYWTREAQGTVDSDSGCSLRESIKTTVKRGVAPEVDWPYDISKFTHLPSSKADKDALKHQTLVYQRVLQTSLSLRSVLHAGFPVVCGVSVYESFENALHGSIPMPEPSEALLGQHAITLIGYDWDNAPLSDVFYFENQWGEDWGDQGFGTIPAKYVFNRDLASDFWVIRSVEG